MDGGMTYLEKVSRIMFLREHRRNLLTAFCREEVESKEKKLLTQELAQVKRALQKLDPEGIFPP